MDEEAVFANSQTKLKLGNFLRQSPREQEKREDRFLDASRSLIEQNQLLIDPGDLEVIKERFASAREMKSGRDSKPGLQQFLHAQEYRKTAIAAYRAVETASRTTIDEMLLDCDLVTGVALSLRRIYLSCIDAFPTPQVKAEWGEAVWREACAKTGTDPESFIPFEIFADGNVKLFTETKKRIVHIVEAQYGFDTSHVPDSISRNATLSQALLSDMAFIYREPYAGGTRHHPYQHPALQKVINTTWFRNKDDDGVVFYEYFSTLSVPAIAFILAVIECCIDEWRYGARKETKWDEKRFKTVYQLHIRSLNDFWKHNIAQDVDLFEHIRTGLLKEARKHAGAPPVPVT